MSDLRNDAVRDAVRDAVPDGGADATSDVGNMLHRVAPPESRPIDLIGLLEERIHGLVDRYRGAQKGAEELRTRLDSAEADLGLLQARVEESDRLREELRGRVQSLIDQVRRLETASAGDGTDGEAADDTAPLEEETGS
ncbi:MAG: hypothetical protein JRG82_02885 [Deltaproteobacteria bacterium]|nr:hypothetical protein [Deltaproteobacteria bacterium]